MARGKKHKLVIKGGAAHMGKKGHKKGGRKRGGRKGRGKK